VYIDIAINYLRELITYLMNYRENGFSLLALESTKNLTIKRDIEEKVCETLG
jgi:hypothetical protein